jgi:hypothetical protein
MSGGGGNALSDFGGHVSGFMTGGAVNTNGGGWAQGGDIKSGITGAHKDGKGGLGRIIKGAGLGAEDIAVGDVPGKASWNLSGADGKLRSDLLLGNEMPQSFNQSQDVLNKLQSNAMATGPSQSAQYLQGANTRNTQNALGNAEAQSGSNLASIMGQLSSRGGADSGSRERAAKSNGMASMMNKQKIMNDSNGNNMDILANDEKQKQSSLQALPASLLAQAGMGQSNKQFDISNTLGTVGGKYNQDMSAWAAGQSAKEQAALANKNNGLLGLGVMGL